MQTISAPPSSRLRPIALVLAFSLSSCSGFLAPHKIVIQQGNHVDQLMIDKLEPGMTKKQVKYVMGTPLVIDTFDSNRWHYISSYSRGNDEFAVASLTLVFENDELAYFTGDYKPSDANTSNDDDLLSSSKESES